MICLQDPLIQPVVGRLCLAPLAPFCLVFSAPTIEEQATDGHCAEDLWHSAMPLCSAIAIVAACVVRFSCVVQCALRGYVEYNTTHSVSFPPFPWHALWSVMWWTWMYGLCLLCHSNTCKHFCKCKCVYISCVGRSCFDYWLCAAAVHSKCVCVCGAL